LGPRANWDPHRLGDFVDFRHLSPSTWSISHIETTTTTMDTQLRDEAAQDRVRAAKEFLDPSKSYHSAATEGCFLIWCFFFSSSR
jgi:hypothetical protein